MVSALRLRADQPAPPPPNNTATTQYSSVAAVFDAVPSEDQAPDPKANSTELQLDRIRQTIKTANQWLDTNAVSKPVTVAGTVNQIAARDDGTVEVSVNIKGLEHISISCRFPKSAADKLIQWNVGDQISIDGSIAKANLELISNFIGASQIYRTIDVEKCTIQRSK